jgi:hypothetical protein
MWDSEGPGLFVDDEKERREMRSRLRNEEQTDDCRADCEEKDKERRKNAWNAQNSVQTVISGDFRSGRACCAVVPVMSVPTRHLPA